MTWTGGAIASGGVCGTRSRDDCAEEDEADGGGCAAWRAIEGRVTRSSVGRGGGGIAGARGAARTGVTCAGAAAWEKHDVAAGAAGTACLLGPLGPLDMVLFGRVDLIVVTENADAALTVLARLSAAN